MAGQYLVIGLGKFGSAVAKTLFEAGKEVLAIDYDEQIVQKAHEQKIATHVVAADASDKQALLNLDIGEDFKVGVVCIGDNMESSLLVTAILKELGVKKVIAKAISEIHGKILEKIGADQVVYPDEDAGIRLARLLTSSNVLEAINLLPDYSIVEVKASFKFKGKTLRQLAIRKNFGANVIAVKKKDRIIVSPMADYVVEDGDIFVVVIETKRVSDLENY